MTAYTIDIRTARRKDFDDSRSQAKRAGASYDAEAKTWNVEIDEAGSDDANDQLGHLIWAAKYNGAKVYADGNLVDVDELERRSRAAWEAQQQRKTARQEGHIPARIATLVRDVVGETEAANIDIEQAENAPDGTIVVGDQNYDGCLTVGEDDSVIVWAQGVPNTAETITGAYDYYQSIAK